MNSMRKWVGLLMVLAFAAFALPAAAQKVYTLNMSTLSMTGGLGQSVTATFNNISPDTGNSTVKSIKLFAPSGVTIKAPATSLAVPVNIGNGYTAYIQNNGNSIWLSSINIPLKPFAALPVALSMTVDVACSGGGEWTTKATPTGVYQVWNGSTFTGQTFAQQNGPQILSIGSGGCNSVTYDGNANDIISGTPPSDTNLYPVGATVTVLGNTGNLKRTSYYFAGWTLAPDGSGTVYLAGSQYTMGATSPTFYARWLPNTVTIGSAPTSAIAGTAFNVTVNETPGGPAPTMTSTCGATTTTTPTSPATSTTFSVTIPNLGACAITFSVPNYASATLNLTAYYGALGCNDYDSSLGAGDNTFNPNTDKAYVVPNGSGWGLVRGPNRDGSACNVKVNYTCTLDPTTNVANCSYDKLSGQLATFKYVFVFAARAADSTGESTGWTNYRPQVSWGVANPDTTSANAFKLPDWVPMLACVDDMFPSSPTLPTVLLPYIPSVAPFTDSANTWPQYQPTVQALVCGAQLGWTSSGDITTGNVKLQHWLKVIDEADVVIKGPG